MLFILIRLREAALEEEARDAAEANAKNEETDSDDDVQFISTSFDPEIAAKNRTVLEQNSNLAQTLGINPSSGPRYVLKYSKALFYPP